MGTNWRPLTTHSHSLSLAATLNTTFSLSLSLSLPLALTGVFTSAGVPLVAATSTLIVALSTYCVANILKSIRRFVLVFSSRCASMILSSSFLPIPLLPAACCIFSSYLVNPQQWESVLVVGTLGAFEVTEMLSEMMLGAAACFKSSASSMSCGSFSGFRLLWLVHRYENKMGFQAASYTKASSSLE